MTEILTESFCERCGTRYTFETVAPRQKKLGGLKTIGRGLKTFVLSDDTSLDEAFASARSDEERELAGHQLDAFHKTFNFCMNCRQYTCANCWNPVEARCLSCAPRADQVIGDAPLQLASAGGALAAPGAAVDALLGEPGVATPLGGALAWPTEFDAPAADLPVLDAADLLGRLEATEVEPAAEPAAAWPEQLHELEPEHVHEAEAEHLHELHLDDEHIHAPGPDREAVAATNGLEPDLEGLLATSAELATANEPRPTAKVAEEASPAAALFEAAAEEAAEAAADAAAQAAAEAAAEAAAQVAAETAAQAAATPPSVETRARDAAAATGALLGRFRPGQSLDAEIDAYERSLADEMAPSPVPVDVAPEPEPFEPEPVAEPVAAAEPAPEPVSAAEPAPEPIAVVEPTAEPEPIAAAAAPEPEAPTTRRDIVEQPAWPSPEVPAAAPDAEPSWPTGARWPTALPARPEASPPPPPQPVPPPIPAPVAANPPAAAEADALAFLTARRAGEAMWAASAQDVVSAGARPGGTIPAGVRSCVSCGLSLSATARFCRRCGTRQEEG